jgi:allantoin racemase
MPTIALLNPNTSRDTLERMLALARPLVPPGHRLLGALAEHGPSMIVDEAGLAAAAREVVRVGTRLAESCQAIVVAAFGGPGADRLRALTGRAVVGLGEAALQEASAQGRFGVVTTTPALAASIERQARALAAGEQFTGVRLATGDPLQLAADPALQLARLAEAVEHCIADGARSVVIGGGPLSDTGRALRERYGDLIVEPVPAAIRCVLAALEGRAAHATSRN